MSLRYDLSKTAFHAQPQDIKEKQWPIVESIIHLTMVIGIGSFTVKTIDEVIARLRFYEKLNGAFLRDDLLSGVQGSKIIRSLIGLSTNVTFETRGKFTKRITDLFFGDVLRDIKPKPIGQCECGHTEKEHNPNFQEGHGPCAIAGCGCRQFTWTGWAK